ncbi:hypothetical protein [Streptomyces sp. NPDC101132]|uniref:hypothetical protein n=1 Tax=Streptomyces sp. NPDC101132 TaxID=3366110 RepID=UPI00382CBD3D
MTEQPESPLGTPAAAATATPAPAAAPADPAARRGARRKAVAMGAAVLVLASLAAGGVWADARLAEADRTAPTVVLAEAPVPSASATPAPTRPAGLAGSLLPVPGGYELGPDIDEFGRDVELSERQAVAQFKESSRNLPAAQRSKQSKAVDKLGLGGMAMRSYRALGGDLVVEIKLAQIKNAKDGRKLAQYQKEFADWLGIFRKGPKIEGHGKASCFLLPKTDGSKLDGMFCSAYEGDVLVSMMATGPKPFQTTEAASILREQLDHLTSPGERV